MCVEEPPETLLCSLLAAAANAVLDCIEQSRTVVLVPTSSDPCLESGLLSAIHATRVERRSRLVFIQTNAEQRPRLGSVPEALHLLAEAGDRVTWKGSGSMSLSSSFWKQLRYYLPALQDVKKIRLLSKANQDVIWVIKANIDELWRRFCCDLNTILNQNFYTVCSIILSGATSFQLLYLFSY